MGVLSVLSRNLRAIRTMAGACALVVLASCATDDGPGYTPGGVRPGVTGNPTTTLPPLVGKIESVEEFRTSDGLTPPHLNGQYLVRAAILLPFSHTNPALRAEAVALRQGAELAIFEANFANVVLIPRDSGSTPESAAAAARAAIADGAEIVIGPLLGAQVPAVAAVARSRDIPVISFSNDRTVAGNGVYLLSYSPEQEVSRVVSYAARRGVRRFAAMTPDNELGRRLEAAFSAAVTREGRTALPVERYARDSALMLEPAKRLANGLKAGAPAGTPGQAVLLPEKGTMLRALAPLFPFNNVDMKNVKVLGTSSWGEDDLSREASLRSGWFAAPDPTAHIAFDSRFKAAFGVDASRLAGLSYDATFIVATLSNGDGRNKITRKMLENPQGYLGVDGLFRFLPDGTVERGLAVMELAGAGPRVIDPAPKAFASTAGF